MRGLQAISAEYLELHDRGVDVRYDYAPFISEAFARSRRRGEFAAIKAHVRGLLGI